MLISVCETKKYVYNSSNDRANCKIVFTKVCFDPEKLDCRDVPKTVCEIDNGPKESSIDETSVSDFKVFDGLKERYQPV